MGKTEVKNTINVSPDKVWETISTFAGLEKFLPAIESSVTRGEGVGMERTCTMGSGASFDETLLKVDSENMELQYNVHDPSPLPFSNYVSNMKVNAVGANQSEVLWNCTFEPDGATEEEADAMLSDLFLSGIDGLEKLLS